MCENMDLEYELEEEFPEKDKKRGNRRKRTMSKARSRQKRAKTIWCTSFESGVYFKSKTGIDRHRTNLWGKAMTSQKQVVKPRDLRLILAQEDAIKEYYSAT